MPLSQVGRDVLLIKTIQIYRDETVHFGETGTVTAINPDTGEVWITLHKRHAGLCEQDNTIWIFPPGHPDYDGLWDAAFLPLPSVSKVELLDPVEFIRLHKEGRLPASIAPRILRCGT